MGQGCGIGKALRRVGGGLLEEVERLLIVTGAVVMFGGDRQVLVAAFAEPLRQPCRGGGMAGPARCLQHRVVADLLQQVVAEAVLDRTVEGRAVASHDQLLA